MKTYKGFGLDKFKRYVKVDDGNGSHPLDPARSQSVRNHSPDGFNWGYTGSGAHQLGLAILLDLYPKKFAMENYQAFTRFFVADFPDEGFEINSEEIREWMVNKNGKQKVTRDTLKREDT